MRRRTTVDYRLHTKEHQDFYETILLDRKPIVCDMSWVDWEYIKENEDPFQVYMTASNLVELTSLLDRSSPNGMMS